MNVPDQPGTLFDIYHRRSVRSYTPQQVDKATLERLLDAAVQPVAVQVTAEGLDVGQLGHSVRCPSYRRANRPRTRLLVSPCGAPR